MRGRGEANIGKMTKLGQVLLRVGDFVPEITSSCTLSVIVLHCGCQRIGKEMLCEQWLNKSRHSFLALTTVTGQDYNLLLRILHRDVEVLCTLLLFSFL